MLVIEPKCFARPARLWQSICAGSTDSDRSKPDLTTQGPLDSSSMHIVHWRMQANILPIITASCSVWYAVTCSVFTATALSKLPNMHMNSSNATGSNQQCMCRACGVAMLYQHFCKGNTLMCMCSVSCGGQYVHRNRIEQFCSRLAQMAIYPQHGLW